MSDLVVQLYDRNKSCQKSHLNNIDSHDQPSRMDRSPPRIHQHFPNSKNSKITVISNDTRVGKVGKYPGEKHWFPWSTFQDASFSPQELPKIQTLQLFPMTPYIVLVEIKVVKNYVTNNFKLHDQLSRICSFHSKSFWSCFFLDFFYLDKISKQSWCNFLTLNFL